MRVAVYLFGAMVLSAARDTRGEDCAQFRQCALGTLREQILNWHSTDKSHPLARALRTYRRSTVCKDALIEAKQDEMFTEEERVHDFGPQCTSSFSFTAFEAVVAHMLLILNAAIATSYLQDYHFSA